MTQPQSSNGYDPRPLLDASSEQDRTQLMRSMGVVNLDPPLPHSPCLKNIKTGIVLPWNELLAQQRDLVVCCDEQGNTDPKAWESKVIHDTTTSEMLSLLAQQTLFTPSNPYEQRMSPTRQVVGPTGYDQHDAVAYKDIEQIMEKLKNAGKPADTGSVAGSE